MLFYRFDDLGRWNDNFAASCSLLEELKLPYIVAAIPERIDPPSAAFLASTRYCWVAQHGFAHVNHASLPIRDEFPETRSYNEVMELLKQGRSRLEDLLGKRIEGYVPPWNTTADQTIRALEETGFKWFSSHVRSRTVTSMRNVGVSVDVIASYRPLVFSSREDILQQVADQTMQRDAVGVVFHVNQASPSTHVDIQRIIRELSAMSYSSQQFSELLGE